MSNENEHKDEAQKSRDFLREEIDKDLAEGRYKGVITRFPPEPNAYLTIGHTKAICINFGIAEEFGGQYNLRFDDTNPAKEEQEYVDAIKEDIRWLGFEWGEHEYYASDYFPQLYEWAIALIEKGLAYVDDQTADEIRENRGTLKDPGKDSPYRERSIEENLDLFARMKAGEFSDGAKVLRAKIDMASSNINLRDPVMYRILHIEHHRAGNEWCIYPIYDWAHGQSDSLEGVTHSMCSHEFINNRPLYDWYIEKLGIFPSRQIEFARGNITYTALSKRYDRQLIEEGHADAGTTRASTPCADCAAAAAHPRQFAASGLRSASPAGLIILISRFWNSASATSSTRPQPGAWAYSIRSKSSSKTIPRARARNCKRLTTPRTRALAHERCPFHASSISSAMILWRIHRANSSA